MKIFGYTIKRDAKNGARNFKFQNRGQYKIVDGYGQTQIAPSSQEDRTEDQVLDHSKRARLLDLTRNLVRNSSLFNTILGQLTTNVVSSCGGKVLLDFDNDDLNDSLRMKFSDFTRNADFYTGDTYNKFLKRVLREYVVGGGCVLVFDNGLIEDSGKVLLFESEEIVGTTPEAIESHYGKGCYQSQGKVFSPNGRHIGTVVSRSQRGREFADPTKCFFLHKDPNANPLENSWIHYESNWREGRGVSQAASAISTIHQLEDLVSSELMASRRNSQIFCWLTQKAEPEEYMPSAFSGDDDFENMTPDEIEEVAKQESQNTTQTISFNKARENSVVYEALPEGITAQQLQTQHPNSNVETMVDFLANRCAASLGLSKIFATGNPEDGNWRANQLFTYPTILEFQKSLEQICDWTFRNWLKWETRKGEVDSSVLELDLDRCVGWQWKGLDSLDPVANEQANEMKLRNMTSNYREILGQDWKSKLEQSASEIKWLKEHNLPMPQYFLLSGGEATGVDKKDGE